MRIGTDGIGKRSSHQRMRTFCGGTRSGWRGARKGLEEDKKQLELQVDRETLRADTYQREVTVLRTFLREQGHHVIEPERRVLIVQDGGGRAVSCKSEQY